MASEISRRRFLITGAAAGGGAALGLGTANGLKSAPEPLLESPFGKLVEDADGLLDLPPGFRYRVISEQGSVLSGGGRVPGDFDGMAAFAGRRGATVLVRNHELNDAAEESVPGRAPYDRSQPGGTTLLVVDEDRRPVREVVASSGTRDNCAGGATPWGTWITCEEDVEYGHGYAFEVDPRDPESSLSRTPLRAMGRFSHEAVGVDPRTGIVYLTEDSPSGSSEERARPSFLYRFLPDDRRQRPGALQRGGRLQALALAEPPGSKGGALPERARIDWRDVEPDSATGDALDAGCARFSRLEGCHLAGGALWFADTSGGPDDHGRLFRYLPATETLELFAEGDPDSGILHPDNVVVTPFGDLWFCTEGRNRVMGATPAGDLYQVARNRLADCELAGPTFSPDGRTFFINVHSPGVTLAVWGPFPGSDDGDRGRGGRERRLDAARRLSVARPPAPIAPPISPELVEVAFQRGMTPLEAATYERFGVPLA